MKTKTQIILGLYVGMLVSPVTRADVLTPAELAVLPPYCLARIGENKDLYEVWKNRLGAKQFIHIHHYCFGLGFLGRARSELDQKKRKVSLQGAIRNFDYVLERWPATFQLTSQARGLKGQAEAMLNRP
ncbi:MAG: hypothetical protein IT494_00585 [Gammaproteobacteria bacterium]|nr:hypothetical protein [Gammaproteobacteria bacterium]